MLRAFHFCPGVGVLIDVNPGDAGAELLPDVLIRQVEDRALARARHHIPVVLKELLQKRQRRQSPPRLVNAPIEQFEVHLLLEYILVLERDEQLLVAALSRGHAPGGSAAEGKLLQRSAADSWGALPAGTRGERSRWSGYS